MSDNEFFIILHKVEGEVKAHAIRHGDVDKDSIATTFSNAETKNSEEKDSQSEKKGPPELDTIQSPFPDNFSEVEKAFSQAILMYRNSVLATLKFTPHFTRILLGINIEQLASSKGKKRDDLSIEEIDVYTVPKHAIGAVKRHKDKSNALIEGVQHLPKISTIGIISSYDAILSDLLRVISRKNRR